MVALLLVDESFKVHGSQLGWSVGMEILSFIFVIATASIVSYDRFRTGKAGKLMRKSMDLSLIRSTSETSFARTSTLADLPMDETEF